MGRYWTNALESEYNEGQPVNRSSLWYPNGQLQKHHVYYDSPDNFDLYEYNERGDLINKKIYFPPDTIDRLLKKSADISQQVENLKEKLEKIKELQKKSSNGK